MAGEGRTARSVTLAAPRREVDRPIPFEGEAGAVRFTVPEIAVITW